MFNQVDEIIPKGGSINLIIKRMDSDEGKLQVHATIVFPKDSEVTPIPPLRLIGTPEELEEGFAGAVNALAPAVIELSDTVSTVQTALKARGAEQKAKLKSGSSKTSTPIKKVEEEINARREGEINEDHVSSLKTIPSSDNNFTTALKDASLASLNTALEASKGLTKLKALAGEIKKITGVEVKDTLFPILKSQYEAASGSDKTALGEQIEKIMGKKLDELGLKAKVYQLSMTSMGN